MKIESVLIVDDNEGDQLLVRLAVEEYDAAIVIHTAFDGQEALDTIATLDNAPSIIFLDINMPGMNGHEFLAEYSLIDHGSSVITMLTSSDQEIDKKLCLQYSFVKRYALKPIGVDDIKEIVEEY